MIRLLVFCFFTLTFSIPSPIAEYTFDVVAGGTTENKLGTNFVTRIDGGSIDSNGKLYGIMIFAFLKIIFFFSTVTMPFDLTRRAMEFN